MQCSPTPYIINHLDEIMMAPLLLEEKYDENNEKKLEVIMICIKCGSSNLTILTKAVYCRNCRSFKLFRQRKSMKPFPKVFPE